MPTKSDAAALPGARAVAKHVRISPTKARRVVNLVRGLPAKDALTVLQFAPQAASTPVYKVLASAIANAENNERLDPDSLLVAEAFVDEGPTMKRFRPRAQGRAYRIRKRTSHITVVVAPHEDIAALDRRPRTPATTATEPAPATRRRPAAKASAATATEATPSGRTAKKASAAEKDTPATPAEEKPAKTTARKTAAKKTSEPKASEKTSEKTTGKASAKT